MHNLVLFQFFWKLYRKNEKKIDIHLHMLQTYPQRQKSLKKGKREKRVLNLSQACLT